MSSPALHIDIYSDVICPWCYIGKKRLDRVLATPVGEGVTVRWRAYQLQPRIPAEGVDRAAYLRSRYGEDADTARVPSRILGEASAEGLTLDYAAIRTMPNTFTAHRLLWFAYEEGGASAQHRLAETLFEAYFRDGRDMAEVDALAALAASAGLDAATAGDFLRSDAGTDEVREELEQATDIGISGVPCYVLGGVFPFPGAQTAEVMAQFIERAKSRLTV